MYLSQNGSINQGDTRMDIYMCILWGGRSIPDDTTVIWILSKSSKLQPEEGETIFQLEMIGGVTQLVVYACNPKLLSLYWVIPMD